jgi:hypothetical protein
MTRRLGSLARRIAFALIGCSFSATVAHGACISQSTGGELQLITVVEAMTSSSLFVDDQSVSPASIRCREPK